MRRYTIVIHIHKQFDRNIEAQNVRKSWFLRNLNICDKKFKNIEDFLYQEQFKNREQIL